MQRLCGNAVSAMSAFDPKRTLDGWCRRQHLDAGDALMGDFRFVGCSQAFGWVCAT